MRAALLDAGVRRVVHAQADPGAASGGGADTLRAAGVEVVGGVLADEALALNRAWTFAVVHGRPLGHVEVRRDAGRAARRRRRQQPWITGPLARADVHDLRAECGAVLVGTGTVLADDPHLTVRQPDGTLPAPAAAARGHGAAAAARHGPGAGRRGADRAACPPATRARRWRRSPTVRSAHVWLEGGPTLAAAFLRAGLVDEVVRLPRAGPARLRAARRWATSASPSIDRTLRLTVRDVRTIGPDVRIRATTPQGEH